MSRVSIRRCPAAALISSARACSSRTPCAISSRGTPCEPEWMCRRVSHGRSRQARTSHSRAPGSRRATPNFEVDVAVDSASMEPAPVCGLIRTPIGDAVGAPATSASRRSSSCRLSALTAIPSASASRSSAVVLAGESRTVRAAGTPAARASASSPGLATSQPRPAAASSRSTGTSGAAFTAKACRTGVPGARASAKAAVRAAAEARIPSASSRQTRGSAESVPPTSPCSTAARTTRSRRSAAPSPSVSAAMSAIPSPDRAARSC